MRKKLFFIFLIFVFSKCMFVSAETVIDGFTGWDTNGKDNFYYVNGVLQKGIIKIDGTAFFLGENTGRLITTGWIHADDGNTYYVDNKGILYSGFQEIDGITYYFNSLDYKLEKGITEIDGITYFLGENTGRLIKIGWIHAEDGNTYYVDNKGILYSGFQEIDGVTYYFNFSDYKLEKGITEIDGIIYFLGENTGRLITTGWIHADDGNTYYVNEKGIIQKGITKIDNDYYFLEENSGRLITTGWIHADDGNTYYVNENGIIQKGITKIDNDLYFLGENTGRLITTGWIHAEDGNTYYVNKNGIIQKGITKIDNDLYFLGENTGRLITTGWIHADDGNTYYVNNKGILLNNWQIIGQDKYYFDVENYYLFRGVNEINGQLYFLGEITGRLITNNWIFANTGNVYFTDSNGIITVGDKTIDGVQYHFHHDGVLKNGWKTENENTYYYDANGNKITGYKRIMGIGYWFSSSGILLGKEIYKVVDVSSHQSKIDWNRVINTDVTGAIVRLGYGTSYSYEDPVLDSYFDYNYNSTTNQRLLRGIYLYSYAIDQISATREAEFVYSYLSKYNVSKSVIIYYDLEENKWTNHLGKLEYDVIVSTFSNYLGQYGYHVAVYTYKFLAENKFSDFVKNKVEWIAHYNDTCTYNGSYKGWQYTANGRVDGINGDVDLSLFWN